MLLRLDERDGRSHRRGRHDTEEPDWAAADNGHFVARVDAVGGNGRVVCDRERFDKGTLREGDLVRDAVQPRRLRDEVLRVRSTDRKSEMVVSVVDDAFADHAIALSEVRDVGSNV